MAIIADVAAAAQPAIEKPHARPKTEAKRNADFAAFLEAELGDDAEGGKVLLEKWLKSLKRSSRAGRSFLPKAEAAGSSERSAVAAKGASALGERLDGGKPVKELPRNPSGEAALLLLEEMEGERMAAADEKAAPPADSPITGLLLALTPPVEKSADGAAADVRPDDNAGKAEAGRTAPAETGSRPRLVVVDLRPEGAGEPASEASPFEAVAPPRAEPGREDPQEGAVRFFARVSNDGQPTAFREIVPARPQAPRFQEMLKNEVLRHSTIILKEGGGELRLILKAESLGRVRINLHLNNNHIAGRIIVENSSVKEMFESNLQSLQDAFRSEGYASSNLEVSVGAGNEQRGGRERLPKYVAARDAAAEFENSVPAVQEVLSGDWVVNLTV